MPCRDDGQAADHAAEMIRNMQQKLDLVTRLLCEMFTKHGSHTQEQADWWYAHMEADRQRQKNEANEELRRKKRAQERIRELENEIAHLRQAHDLPEYLK